MKEIPLTQGKIAIVDKDDYVKLSKFKWRYHSTGYARTTIYNHLGRKRVDIYMHRMIMNPERRQFIDHVNGNKLDNRKENLRIASKAQNEWNTGLRKNNTSGYKGVTYFKKLEKWRAQITFENKVIHLGLFTTPEEAAIAYNQAAKELYGKYAKVNDIDSREGV